MTWMTGTYDPGLNLLYWGTGNPTPVLNGKSRPGDNLYTCSIRGAESGHGQTDVGVPALAARHARLGCGGDAGAGGCGFQGQAAQDADADFAQRLLLRARPDQRRRIC